MSPRARARRLGSTNQYSYSDDVPLFDEVELLFPQPECGIVPLLPRSYSYSYSTVSYSYSDVPLPPVAATTVMASRMP